MSSSDFNQFQEEFNASISKDCAQEVAERYDGVKCRGTILHAYTPNYEEHCQLFFDKKFMKKYTSTTSTSSLYALPGYHYYVKVSEFFTKHYTI